MALSDHAIDQYCDRVRPGLDAAAARTELARLLPNGTIVATPPGWVRAASIRPYYLLIGDAVALPLTRQQGGWLATTCVTQTSLTDRDRQQRAHYKASRSARQRAKRRASW